jgi:hypothetical protein
LLRIQNFINFEIIKNIGGNSMKYILTLTGIIFFFISCQSGTKSVAPAKNQDGIHSAVVLEVLQAGPYTYLRVKDGESEIWIAVSSIQAEVGKTYYYKQGMEMKNFHSKELNRDFPSVFFVDQISTDPNLTSGNMQASAYKNDSVSIMSSGQGNKPLPEKQKISIDKAAGGVTIAELYSKKEKYNGKKIKVKGKVTKFSPAIMKRNWIHIQDGTENNDEFDLTITSDINVKTGDIITIEGKVSLDKDFGAGYFYKVIIEDATLIK